MRKYEGSHPWIKFELDLSRAPYQLWIMLGECQSKIEHLAGVPLRPDTADELHRLYLAKGVRATTAIEGNTLSEEEVLAHLEKNLKLPPSRAYLQQEIENIVAACNKIAEEAISGQPTAWTPRRINDFNMTVLSKLALGEGVVPGEISSFNVTVGRYLAAPREDCQYLLERLCGWLNSDAFEPKHELQIGMAVLKAILAHLYLAWIHPYGDGNGRVARLVEFDILLAAGVPAPAAHLLSNHYNLTREEYYRQLDLASKSGGDVIPFVLYAVQGLLDGLREQIERVREQQRDVAWENYVHEKFRDRTSPTDQRRRHLVLDLSGQTEPVHRSDLPSVSLRVMQAYSGRGEKTLSRDINLLEKMGLIRGTSLPRKAEGLKRENIGYVANKDIINAFLPLRRRSN